MLKINWEMKKAGCFKYAKRAGCFKYIRSVGCFKVSIYRFALNLKSVFLEPTANNLNVGLLIFEMFPW